MGVEAISLSVIVGLAVAILALLFLTKYKSKQIDKVSRELEVFKEKAAPLWQYQCIEDAQAEAESKKRETLNWVDQQHNVALSEAARIQAKARGEIADLSRAATTERESLLAEAKEARAEAKNRRDRANQKAEELVNQAHTTANGILEQANSQALQIAGDAIKAKENADLHSSAAIAMKNTIKGYGDEYIVPNHTVLDDLAEDFSHKDAGQKLKDCRAVTKSMVMAGKAADCDYVEPTRRETAIHFVLDAFNGKVDTTMSKVKRDNLGKLKQQIIDAFSLVNLHGAAFRNARITDTYQQARLNELKWAVATEELRQQEREEQRAIKAQIREEERARREFEKAQQEAEKEERALEKAMIKARKEIEKASEAERGRYEQELAELQQKWEEAESRGQRALSMAQQTKRGHVYIISNIGSFGEDVFKVGMTRRLDPMDRVRELGDASVPFNFDIHAMIYSEDAPRLENELHRRFGHTRLNRVNLRREFFKVSLLDLKSVVSDLGIEAHWTMMAEAAQYRESRAIALAEAEAGNEEVVA